MAYLVLGQEGWTRGLTKLGAGHSEDTSVETSLPTDTDVVPAQRVVEAGSPALSERISASRAG